MPRCASCDRDNPTGTELCRNCGARLAERSGESLPPQAGSAPDEASSQADVEGPGLDDLVLPHLREGRKIQAVKVYREETGVDLKDAKDAVEAIAAKHGVTSQGAGCTGVLLLAIVAGGTLAAWL